jgi:hypothetical protein
MKDLVGISSTPSGSFGCWLSVYHGLHPWLFMVWSPPRRAGISGSFIVLQPRNFYWISRPRSSQTMNSPRCNQGLRMTTENANPDGVELLKIEFLPISIRIHPIRSFDYTSGLWKSSTPSGSFGRWYSFYHGFHPWLPIHRDRLFMVWSPDKSGQAFQDHLLYCNLAIFIEHQDHEVVKPSIPVRRGVAPGNPV